VKSDDALGAFNRLLKARNTSAAMVSVADGMEAMFELYRSTRADDCSLERDGDMLLFQWGTYDWGQGRHFELDITRQFIRDSSDDDDDDIWQLSLTFLFTPNELKAGNRWCRTPDELEEFAQFVRSHAAFAVAAEATRVRVDLGFHCAG
jgi:hypothetical protein